MLREVVGMKWFCAECDETFEEEEIRTETTWSNSNYIGFGGDYPETESYCPYCGSAEIYECEKCELCGEEVPRTIYAAGKDMCPECKEQLDSIMKALIMDITGQFEKIDSMDAENIIKEYY